MKKKIKDLTLEEYNNICDSRKDCKGCPFEEFDNISNCREIKYYIQQRELNKILEQEVEVEETPKKPIKYLDNFYGCPNCDVLFQNHHYQNYCPKCGQKLDWSDEDGK